MNTAPPARTAALGFWMAFALVMGSMIGSGVYLLPASLAPFGWNALYGWVFTIAGVLCLAFTLAALARALPKAGGPYGFVLAAFGPLPAFMVGWAYVISIWVANAALTIAAVSYLSVLSRHRRLPAVVPKRSIRTVLSNHQVVCQNSASDPSQRVERLALMTQFKV